MPLATRLLVHQISGVLQAVSGLIQRLRVKVVIKWITVGIFMILYVAVHCDPLPAIVNGKKSTNETVFDTSVHFSCNLGYALSVVRNLTCYANGSWSSDVPFCEGNSFFSLGFVRKFLWNRNRRMRIYALSKQRNLQKRNQSFHVQLHNGIHRKRLRDK